MPTLELRRCRRLTSHSQRRSKSPRAAWPGWSAPSQLPSPGSTLPDGGELFGLGELDARRYSPLAPLANTAGVFLVRDDVDADEHGKRLVAAGCVDEA